MTSSRDPSPILETGHLRLRPIQLEDLTFIQTMRANGEVMQEIGDLPTEPDKVAEEVRKARPVRGGWRGSRALAGSSGPSMDGAGRG